MLCSGFTARRDAGVLSIDVRLLQLARDFAAQWQDCCALHTRESAPRRSQ
jgi:hypothetical protein